VSARGWAWVALAGVLVYVAVDITLAVIDPWYSLLRNAESDYGFGAHAWLMDLNFLIRLGFSAAALLAFSRSGARGFGLWALGVWALASGLLAFLPDQPLQTLHARLHLLLAPIDFLAIAAATLTLSFSTAQGTPRGLWRLVLRGIAVAGAAALLLVFGAARVGALGLFERVFLGLEILWVALAAGLIAAGGARAWQAQSGAPAEEPAAGR
jgi:hypothetical membrane protein